MSVTKNQLKFHKMRRLPIILQDEIAECAHASIAMVSNYWGHDLDLFAVRKIRQPSAQGINLREIISIFEHLGFRARALKISLEELKQVKCPAILHWNLNHFVVLKQVKGNNLIIHDPATGIIHCKLNEASNHFTGILLEVEKTEDFQKIRAKNNLSLLDLAKSVGGLSSFITGLLCLSLAIEIFSLINPLLIQYIMDDVIAYSNLQQLGLVASAFILLLLVQILSEYLRGKMVIYLTNHLNEQFSVQVMGHLLKLPFEFFAKRSKGDIQAKFQAIEVIQNKMGIDFVNTLLDGLMIIINLTVMIIYSPWLTAIVLTAILLYLGLRYISYHHLQKQSASSVYLHAKATSVFLETLQAITPIKLFLKEGARLDSWRNNYINSLNANIKVENINIVYQTAHQFLFHFEHIIVVCVGAIQVLNNRFSLGMLMAFLAYRLLLVNKASSFIQKLFDYHLITIHLNRLNDVVGQKIETVNCGFNQSSIIKGSLSLKNISFSYHSHEFPILHNINLEIKAGEKVAITGPSGCGKSTLLKVMMGLLTPTCGELFIDGQLINQFGLKNYRELSAVVMQDDVLLSGSILDNIIFFDNPPDLPWAYEVANLAGVHDTIQQLPMGYETLVGEMGSTLSGGQKQRILIARALYKRPKILFLDEASNHLDSETEKQLNLSLKSLNITQIIIAHRQDTIQMADRVINMKVINQQR